WHVTLCEQRSFCGGRAYAFREPVTGDCIDNGQHLFMGCYRSTFAYLEKIGAGEGIITERRFTVPMMTADGRRNLLSCPDWRPPWHLLAGLWRLRGFPKRDIARLMAGLIALARKGATLGADRISAAQLLDRLGQSARSRSLFWTPLVLAVCNETPERVSAAPLIAVIREAFGRRNGPQGLSFPVRDLSSLLVAPALTYLRARGSRLCEAAQVTALDRSDAGITGIGLRSGERLTADAYISAMPPRSLHRLLTAGVGTVPAGWERLNEWEEVPICSVHLWADRPIMTERMVGLLDGPFHWAFGQDGGRRVALVTSAARELVVWPRERIVKEAIDALQRYLPTARGAVMRHVQVTKEITATVSLTPGSAVRRLPTVTPWPRTIGGEGCIEYPTRMRAHRTKIVATIGPASDNPKTLTRLIGAGMDIARINLSHGTRDEHRARIHLVRTIARVRERTVGILFDLQGPKMRIGELKNHRPVLLRKGTQVWIHTRPLLGDAQTFSTTYTHLPQDVGRGDPILLDDGRMALTVERVVGRRVRCRVERGGWLGEHKGINVPRVALTAPALAEKDYDDLALAIEEGVDFLALSFVRSGRDVAQLKTVLRRRRSPIPVIAKIERREAIENLKEILAEADGVMVARGDLGVEFSLAEVPILQKAIIKQANSAGLVVITATQMLETMIDEAQPTRAEASDIANAIFDQTDAVMLSGETAMGKYPVEAVKAMADIVTVAERSPYHRPLQEWRPRPHHSVAEAVVRAAAQAAQEEHVKAIVLFTMTGTTARLMSKMRPGKPILALTADPQVAHQMTIYWGVEPFVTRTGHTTDQMIELGERTLVKEGRLRRGDRVVVVAGTHRLRGATNMMKFLTI
ncbi:MAG: pyruvate kinase, partial [Deltaproteobacteria bacterium]|nr:pyruvate kinase [Deltaproteobacteria bacterium]